MTRLDDLRRLWDHLVWADRRLLDVVRANAGVPQDVVREYAHLVGAEEVWLARLEGRPARVAVWPGAAAAELPALVDAIHQAWGRFLAAIGEEDLTRPVEYTNSVGVAFTTPVGEILLHVALHAQYHRGKVNLLLRQAGLDPAPADFIAFVRGAPAATEASARRR